jgi:predicted  nucleic acid-binding Zn ribbon protein
MYHNKFLKQKTDNNWEAYRKQRNLVTKLKKKTSIKTYFFDRTAGDKNIKIDKTHPSILSMPYLHHHLQFGFQNSQTVDLLRKKL